jgi:hypothetical protein
MVLLGRPGSREHERRTCVPLHVRIFLSSFPKQGSLNANASLSVCLLFYSEHSM